MMNLICISGISLCLITTAVGATVEPYGEAIIEVVAKNSNQKFTGIAYRPCNSNNEKKFTGRLQSVNPMNETCDLKFKRDISVIAAIEFERCQNFIVRTDDQPVLIYSNLDRLNASQMRTKAVGTYPFKAVYVDYRTWKGIEATNVNSTSEATLQACTRTPHAGSGSSVLFVCISFIVLMCIALAWLIFYYVQRFHTVHKLDRENRFLVRATEKVLSQMKVRRLKGGDAELSPEAAEHCAVCLEAYREGDHLRTLHCSHIFHKACVDPWLLAHRSCPMCKTDILRSLPPSQRIELRPSRLSTRGVAQSMREALFSPSLDMFTSSRHSNRARSDHVGRESAAAARDSALYSNGIDDATLPLQTPDQQDGLQPDQPIFIRIV